MYYVDLQSTLFNNLEYDLQETQRKNNKFHK